MNLTSVSPEDVRILTEIIGVDGAEFYAVPRDLLPDDFARKVGFSTELSGRTPVQSVLNALTQLEPMDYGHVDYRFSAGRLSVKVAFLFGVGIGIHDHHPAICNQDLTKGVFFVSSTMDDLESDVGRGMETAQFSTNIAVSWEVEEVHLKGRPDWDVKESGGE